MGIKNIEDLKPGFLLSTYQTSAGNIHTGQFDRLPWRESGILDHQDHRSQSEVNFINAAAVMQANYNTLLEQNKRLLVQVREMAAILNRIADYQSPIKEANNAD